MFYWSRKRRVKYSTTGWSKPKGLFPLTMKELDWIKFKELKAANHVNEQADWTKLKHREFCQSIIPEVLSALAWQPSPIQLCHAPGCGIRTNHTRSEEIKHVHKLNRADTSYLTTSDIVFIGQELFLVESARGFSCAVSSSRNKRSLTR